MLSYGRTPLSSRKVGQVMQKLGFKCGHGNSGNYYYVFELTPEQSQSSLYESNSIQTADNENVEKEQMLPF